MKKVLIILGVFVLLVVLAVGGLAWFMSNGLKATEVLVIGTIDPARLADGSYEGEYDGGRFANQVAVTVQDGKITAIDVKKTVVFERDEVTKKLFENVIARQNTDVDVESGATVTAKAYLKSIEDALDGK